MGSTVADSESKSSFGLAALIEDSKQPDPLCSPAELASILRHQLAGRLQTDLAPKLVRDTFTSTNRDDGALDTFDDLFRHPRPPIEILAAVKSFAKKSQRPTHRKLPPEVAGVVYYLAIAAAIVRHGRRLTRLSDDELRQGFSCMLAYQWIDVGTRSSLKKAQEQI